MVGVARIELATPAMSTQCSTTELHAHTRGHLGVGFRRRNPDRGSIDSRFLLAHRSMHGEQASRKKMTPPNQDKSRRGRLEDRLALWASVAAFLICILPVILVFGARTAESALDCPIILGETHPCMLGSTDIRALLDGLATPSSILHERNFAFVTICLLGWLAVMIYWIARRTSRKAEAEAGGAWSNRRLLWAAIITLVIGIGPILSNILSEQIANALGCYIAEFEIYTRTGTPLDYDRSGCSFGGMDVGSTLVFFHTLILASLLTWPFFGISIFLWARLVGRRTNRRSV